MYGTEHARDRWIYRALYSSVCTAQCRSPLLVISSYIKLKETQLIFFPQACTHESRLIIQTLQTFYFRTYGLKSTGDLVPYKRQGFDAEPHGVGRL